MAQQSKRPTKRAERAAREAAEAQARAKQASKERKQQTIIGIIVIIVVLALLAVAGVAVYRSTHPDSSSQQSSMTKEEAQEQVKTLSSKPKYADDQGGILISANGYNKPVENVPTIGIYMDFMCPGCGDLHRNLDADLVKMVNAGQINLDLHFMAFMDSLSTDEYSSRTANAILYVADHDDDPAHLLSAMENLFSSDFQPQEGSSYKSVSDDQIKEQLEKAGVDSDVANSALTRNYDDWLNAVVKYTTQRTELQATSGTYKGQMSTPTVTINGYFWDIHSTAVTQEPSLEDALLKAIGLEKSQIGVKGDLPSIGADGKPLIA